MRWGASGGISAAALNPEQERAARHSVGPALVLAGPGTGKTTTLVGRYTHLVDQGVDPHRIFVSTFTRKAAEELKTRIRASAELEPFGLPIGTFHSYCYGLTGSTAVIGEPGRFAIIRACLQDWSGDLRSVLDAIDRFKDSLVSPQEALNRARQAPKQDRGELRRIAEAYACYQHKLADEGLVDFGDLVIRSIGSLQNAIPADHRFKHLLIDEYQDINPAQDALINALLHAGGQLWVVGDDDQAIYGWRGSDVRFITSFASRYPGAATYRLKRNYRSSKIIVDVAQSLVSKNTRRLPKSLVSAAEVQSRPLCVMRCRDEQHEAKWVCDAVQKLVASGVPPAGIAILLRTNIQTLEFEAVLDRAGVKFVVRGGGSFWELPVVKALMAAVWRAYGPGGRPPWSGPRYLTPILDEVAAEDRPFPELIDALASAAVSARPRSLPSEKRIQWESGAIRLGSEGRRFGDGGTFLTHCRESTSRDFRGDEEEDAVVVSTIHQAKGLEWEAVFVAGLEDGLLPHNSSDDYEEERRLAYVAASRPRQFLTLTLAVNRAGKERHESPFVAELCTGTPQRLLDRRGVEATKRRGRGSGRRSRFDPEKKRGREARRRGRSSPKKKLSRGERQPGRRKSRPIRVRHAQFGDGTVESICDDKYVVLFDEVGRKKVVSRFLELLPD